MGGGSLSFGVKKVSLALGQALRGNPCTPNPKMGVSRLWGAGIPPLFWCLSSGGSPGPAALEVGPTVPNSVTPFGGGSVMGDGDKLALARGICASSTVCGGRHMALVIPCVPDITIHVSQPGVVSRCCCPCPVSGVTTTVTSARGHACVPPNVAPHFWGSSQSSSVLHWGHIPPVGGGAVLRISRCSGGLDWQHPTALGGCVTGGLRRGTVPGAVGREPGCAAGAEPGTAGVTPVTS